MYKRLPTSQVLYMVNSCIVSVHHGPQNLCFPYSWYGEIVCLIYYSSFLVYACACTVEQLDTLYKYCTPYSVC